LSPTYSTGETASNTMKKSLLALLALFAVALTATVTASAQATPDTSVTATVRVSTWESGANLQYWTNAISDFGKLYPNITVQLEAVPNGYGTNLLAQIAAGNAPDIWQQGDGDVATYVAKGTVTDLTSYISGKNGIDTSALYPTTLTMGQVNGKQYYMTKDYSPLIVYYNTDLLKKAGLDAPKDGWTWADFVKYAQKLTVDANGNDATSANFDPKHIKQWGVQMQWTWDRAIEPIIDAAGGSFISPDGKTTTGYMNSDATVSAVQWYVDLYNKYHVSPTSDDVSSFSGADLFQGGQVAMLWTGIWPADGYAQVKGFNFSTVSLPVGPKGAANVLCWAGFGINAKSQNKDAAWLFLKYITAGDGAKQYAKYALTSVKSLAQEQQTAAPYKAAAYNGLADLKPLSAFTNPHFGDCAAKYFDQELETSLKSGVAVKDAMTKAASEADACLAQS